MIERKYDPTQPYQFTAYGRMSNESQNRRSPDQQFNTSDEGIRKFGYPWVPLPRYRDDGVSGRFLRRRPGLQRMLNDIETGVIAPDLIVVDTLERLGRADEVSELRRKLADEYGILVVAADNGFADPTGVVGKAVGMVEQIRSTENTRVCAHNVTRGKKDAVRRGRWAGGKAPFGYRLRPVVDETANPPDVYSVLEPEPRAAAALRLAFERADATGEGGTRLCKWWNGNPHIPEEFKPTTLTAMLHRLKNRVALGEQVWGQNRTDVVSDTRVVERNPDGPEVGLNFCTPIIDAALFDRVQGLLAARSDRVRALRRGAGPAAPGKLIAPRAPGLALKYLLAGLVRCGSCNAAMRAIPSGRTSKAGKVYVYYLCPRYPEGSCGNAHYVPEGPLREAVVARVRARLFPPPGRDGETPPWFPELGGLIREELARHHRGAHDRADADAREVKDLQRRVAGWAQSLGDPTLPASVRADLTAHYEQAQSRVLQLSRGLAAAAAAGAHVEKALDAAGAHVEKALDPRQVIDKLRTLGEALAGQNPTLGNLELGRHVERVDCFPDGRVVLRGTYLGLFEGAVELLSRDAGPSAAPPDAANGFAPVKPRLRGRLRVPNLSSAGAAPGGGADTVLDPDRFAGLPGPFLWGDPLVIGRTPSWAEANAAEVVRVRATGLTVEKLAAHFGKTPPTILSALRIGLAAAPQGLPRKMPRRRWEEDHADAVLALHATGMGTTGLAQHFGKSEPTILAILKKAGVWVPRGGSGGGATPGAPIEP